MKVENFLDSVKKSDNLIIIYDDDVDGIFSSTIVEKALKKLKIKIKKKMAIGVNKFPNKIVELKEHNAIILDLAVYEYHDELIDTKKILIIDHHPPLRNLNSEKIILINPMLSGKNVYQPTSYLAYKLFSEFINLRDIEWLAVTGTIGDYGFEDCKDLIGNYVKDITKEKIMKTKYGRASIIVDGAVAIIGAEKAANIVSKTKSLQDLLKNKQFNSAFKKYYKLYVKAKKLFWKNLEEIKEIGLMISEIGTKSRMAGSIATEISSKYPHKIVLVIDDVGDKYRIHARYQDGKVHLGELMRKICLVGGGHRQAGGGVIKHKDLSAFKRNVIREIKRETSKI